jgi:hypothetical protein
MVVGYFWTSWYRRSRRFKIFMLKVKEREIRNAAQKNTSVSKQEKAYNDRGRTRRYRRLGTILCIRIYYY